LDLKHAATCDKIKAVGYFSRAWFRNENHRVEITGVTNEQAAALKTGDPVWAWHQNVLTSYDWLEATVTKELDMNLQYVVVDVWIPDPPPGSRSRKTASHLEHRNPARRRTDKPPWRGGI
jgi:hypothetical protein